MAQLDLLHEVRRAEQRLLRAGVEPDVAAAELLDVQVAGFEVEAIEVRDLQLVARPNVLVVPTASNTYKWVVLRRVVGGSVAVSPDAPFTVQSFQSMSDGMAHYATIGSDRVPMIMTTTDGKFLVIALREAQRTRAVGH